MLILSRRKDERVVISEGKIVITVVDIQADKVRLGITAPKDVSVHRQEVYDAIEASEERKEKGS
jgi:carbon storage regulator